ncbi:MAG: hypothetical protein ACO3EE_10715 [Flavobacteriales bacterium]
MIKRSVLFISALALFACGDNSEEVQEVKKPELNLSAEQIKDFKSAAKVFDAMPTPIEMAEIIKESKVVYDVKVLNDPKKTSQYVTSIKQALNLGVYFADLSFTSVFDHPQQSVAYLKAAQKMSMELKINDVFNENIITRMESNQNNKDSLLQIISEAYLTTDSYLFENKMNSVAAGIMAGGWIEALYIATHLDSEGGEATLVRHKISEQKTSLDHLVKLLSDCKDAELTLIKSQLINVQGIYGEMKEVVAADSTKTYNMDNTSFEKIKTTILSLRSSIVN